VNYREFIADKARDCAVVAHRGIWRNAPENSLSAIQRAIDAGYDVVEIDIRRSVDGELAGSLVLKGSRGPAAA
jgi:glycerophosphoryl diester phosphodiesterase